jgi:hypothetical protein
MLAGLFIIAALADTATRPGHGSGVRSRIFQRDAETINPSEFRPGTHRRAGGKCRLLLADAVPAGRGPAQDIPLRCRPAGGLLVLLGCLRLGEDDRWVAQAPPAWVHSRMKFKPNPTPWRCDLPSPRRCRSFFYLCLNFYAALPMPDEALRRRLLARVRAALRAAWLRDDELRRRDALRACRDKALRDAA